MPPPCRCFCTPPQALTLGERASHNALSLSQRRQQRITYTGVCAADPLPRHPSKPWQAPSELSVLPASPPWPLTPGPPLASGAGFMSGRAASDGLPSACSQPGASLAYGPRTSRAQKGPMHACGRWCVLKKKARMCACVQTPPSVRAGPGLHVPDSQHPEWKNSACGRWCCSRTRARMCACMPVST